MLAGKNRQSLKSGTHKPLCYVSSEEVTQGVEFFTCEAISGYSNMTDDMIDGRANNISKKHHKTDPLSLRGEYDVESKPAKNHTSVRDPKKRRSVFQRLNEKKAEVAARFGGKSPEKAKDDTERNRK